MKIAKTISWIGLIAMTAAIMNGFVNGSFSQDGADLLANPWGVVSLIDLYVGFALFSIWIAFRETNTIQTVIWIILVMILGFFTGALYVLVALYKSDGDWAEFFLGKNRKQYIIK